MNDVHHGPEKKAGGVKNFIERQNYVVKLSSEKLANKRIVKKWDFNLIAVIFMVKSSSFLSQATRNNLKNLMFIDALLLYEK